MARFHVWRKSSNAAEAHPSYSTQRASPSPPPPASTTPSGSPKADPMTSSSHTIITDQLSDANSTRQHSLITYSSPQPDSSAQKPSLHWSKVPAGSASGPWGEGFKAYKPPPILTLLDTSAHNPRSPIAWFIEELGIPLLKIVPRKGNYLYSSHCEYELGNLIISKSVQPPSGYREPFITHHDFADGSWRRVPIFSTPKRRDSLHMNLGNERITIAFKVVFLDTSEDDRFVRVSYEESWTCYSFDKPTIEDFYEKYGQVLNRTTEEHRAAREFYMGPWLAEGRMKDANTSKMYEESKRFLKVDDGVKRAFSRKMRGLGESRPETEK